MPQNFIPCDRDQQMLMPTDMREWLSADHPAWFVIDSVADIDLSGLYAVYRDDGWGRAAYDPMMMVTLILYAYAIGVRSSREIERRCTEDVAFRVITTNRRVDHATICRFITRHREPLSELFVSVLRLCAQAGIIRPGVVAIDGTKIAANASAARNVTREQLEDFARRVFDEAERIDREEDDLYGDRRGDEIPEHLVDPEARRRWIREQRAAQHAADEDDDRSSGRRKRINTTDPDSAVQKTPQGYLQGYNAQLAVTEDQVIVAADVVSDNNDVAQLEPMITQAQHNLGSATDDVIVETVVADAGYFSEYNASLDLGVDLLIAPVATSKLSDAISTNPEVVDDDVAPSPAELAIAQRQAAARADVMAGYAARQVTGREAAEALGIAVPTVKYLAWHQKTRGRLPNAHTPATARGPTPSQQMLKRFDQPAAMVAYAQRSRTVEPVIGQIKEARGMRRFLHRGRAAARCEFRMMACAHNLRKLWVKRLETLSSLLTRFLRSLLLSPCGV